VTATQLPDQIQQIIKEDSDERQKTTLEIASSHLDVEAQLAPRIYAEWYIRTEGGTLRGGSGGKGFSPWLKRHEKKISHSTAYRLVHKYVKQWGVKGPERKPRPDPPPPPLPTPELVPNETSSDLLATPTSFKDMEEVFFKFVREIDDVLLLDWWAKLKIQVEAEIFLRQQVAKNHLDAA
jgi:hypothetical protein